MKSTITLLALAIAIVVVPTALARVSPGLAPSARPVSSQGTYGPLDPWAYKLTHSTGPTLITEHSAGQDPDRRPIVLVADPATVVRASGFHWGDAGIGAAAALVAGFVLIAAARFRRRPFAGVSV